MMIPEMITFHGNQEVAEQGSHGNKHVRNDICSDKVISAAYLFAKLLIADNVARIGNVLIGSDVVLFRILLCDLHAVKVDINSAGIVRTKQKSRNGKDTASAAKVKHLVILVKCFSSSSRQS